VVFLIFVCFDVFGVITASGFSSSPPYPRNMKEDNAQGQGEQLYEEGNNILRPASTHSTDIPFSSTPQPPIEDSTLS